MSSPETQPSRLGRLRVRLSRLRLDRARAPYRVWIVVCWLATLGLAAVILIPQFTGEVHAQGSGVIAQFFAPLRFRVPVLIAAALLAGAAVVWATLRDRMARPHLRQDTVLREVVVLVVALFPVLALLADHEQFYALFAALPALLLLVFAHLPGLRNADGATVVLGVIGTLGWVPLLLYQFTPGGSSSESWVWVALFGVGAAFAAFGSYYGVARAAESRSRRLRLLYRADLNPWLVLGVVLASAAVVVVRLTVARELFPDPDPQLWSPSTKPATAWILALIVAGIIAVVAVRASRRPLTQFGERRVVAALAVLGNTELVVSVLVIALGMAVAIVTGGVFLPDSWVPYVPLIKFGGVVLLGLLVLLPMFRRTAARWIGISTAVFLAAATFNSVLAAADLRVPAAIGDFPPSPVQVLLFLLAAALVLAIRNLIVRRGDVNPSLVARLALVPLIAVHAGWLLPAAFSDLGRIIILLGVLVALFWLMPPVAADPTRHAFHVLSASAAQVLALVVFVLAIPSLFGEGAFVVLGLLWLSIPIIAALTIDTETRSIPGDRQQPGSQ